MSDKLSAFLARYGTEWHSTVAELYRVADTCGDADRADKSRCMAWTILSAAASAMESGRTAP